MLIKSQIFLQIKIYHRINIILFDASVQRHKTKKLYTKLFGTSGFIEEKCRYIDLIF